MFQNFTSPFTGSQFLHMPQERRPELENAIFVVFGVVFAHGLVALQAERTCQHSSPLEKDLPSMRPNAILLCLGIPTKGQLILGNPHAAAKVLGCLGQVDL